MDLPCSTCLENQKVTSLCNATHNITCESCPANTWSPPNRTQIEDCFCQAGYIKLNNLCVACPAHKFSFKSNLTFKATFITCPVRPTSETGINEFNFTITAGGKSEDDCVPCVEGKYCVTASTSCVKCVAGKFSSVVGATSMDTC